MAVKKPVAKKAAKPKPQAMQVERVSLAQLHEDPVNARKHGERNIDTIRASLKQHGQTIPLVVQRSSGRVISGNGTLAAMRLLSWKHADVHWMDIGDLAATSLGITMNRSAEMAEWNMDVLEKLLGQLRKEPDLDHDALGFSAEEVDRLVGDAHQSAAGALAGATDDATEGTAKKTGAQGSKELDASEFDAFRNLCPRCGFEFDKPVQVAVTEETMEEDPGEAEDLEA